MIYKLIGRAVVAIGVKVLKRKLVQRTALLAGVGAVAGIATVGVVGYLVTRDVPEA